MTINEKINSKIAKWLGFKTCKKHGVIYKIVENEHVRIDIHLDFLRDRNQQKWIEDKLIKDGYEVEYSFVDGNWLIDIWYVKAELYQRLLSIENQSKDLAFLQAVEQLIDKEDESNKNNL